MMKDDMAKLAGSAFSMAANAKQEIEQAVKRQVADALKQMGVVTREEFEVVKALASKACAEQEKLEARLAALEGKSSK
ncbi:MAG: uncharacterized protein K0R63_1610 [Rickettsiales bacterium]|nr:uncharacterized protein [Rickettsiales bacterium]